MRPDVQTEVAYAWDRVTGRTLDRYADLAGYREDFFKLFGFGWPGVDESVDVDPQVPIPSLDLQTA
jgi:enoyl-[acyl-carrier protein] reductase/trans-2-enoyl-CoA reductase (NAD+)